MTDRRPFELDLTPVRSHSGTLRWVLWALGSLTGAAVAYLFGLLQLFTLDFVEHCTVVLGQPYQPGFGQVSLWPLSRRCNSSDDVVSGWVTPTAAGLLVATLLSLALAARARRRAAGADRP